MEEEISLKKFEISKIKDDAIVVAIGRRRSGKSYCMKDLLYYKHDFPCGIVMSSTENANSHYSHFIPPAFVSKSEHFQPRRLENFMRRQFALTQKKKSNPAYANMDNRAFFIMDDMMYDSRAWRNDRNIKSIFMNGRHWGIFFILTLQYSLGIPPDLRENVDYIFIFRQNKLNERKKLHEHWAGFMRYDVFEAILDECTENFGCIVIDNTTGSNRLEDQIYYYRAEDHGDFKICPERYWKFSNNHPFNREDPDDEYEEKHQKSLRQRGKGAQTQYRIKFE